MTENSSYNSLAYDSLAHNSLARNSLSGMLRANIKVSDKQPYLGQ